MGGAGVLAEDGRLAPELAAALEPGLQDALNHPTRRSVLRVLHANRRPRSISGIVDELQPLSRGEVSYHVGVLQDCGCVAVEGIRPAPRGRERLLRSVVADSDQAVLVLAATQRSDRDHRRRHDDSSSLMTMFRLPRPGRTITLRSSRERREASR